MKNNEVYDIVQSALTPMFNEAIDRHRRFDMTLRIDDRDIRIVSNYKHTSYDIIDAKTGELIGIQPAEDFLTEIDCEWWNKECEDCFVGVE